MVLLSYSLEGSTIICHNETAAYLDFSVNLSVTFLVVQPSTIITLDIIPGLTVLNLGGENRLAD
jgi:hypothetical protein